MIALVDFDNIHPLFRGHSLVDLVTRVTDAISKNDSGIVSLGAARSLLLRLYGGWFEEASLSRSAQRLVPQIQSDFPRPFSVSVPRNSGQIMTRVELAYSLACDPKTTLTHTYRPRSIPPNLNCVVPPFANCPSPGICPISAIGTFFQSQRCPQAGCQVEPASILSRPEQKLVDAMMIVDMIHLSTTRKATLAIVSSDDDLWPGIRQALLSGAQIIHVHPKSACASSSHYSSLMTAKYSETFF